MKNIQQITNINILANAILQTNEYFLNQAQRQVNTTLTLRNWIIGCYIFEYEQRGQDKAEYGEQLFKKLAEKLKMGGIKGLSFTSLHLCKQFYLAYPQIIQSVTEQFNFIDFPLLRTIQPATEQSKNSTTSAELLLGRLSFTHLIELIKADSSLKRLFYETEALRNNWSVRDLKRAMNSMLFERTGISKNKRAVLEENRNADMLQPETFFRNPYILDFLGLKEENFFIENDLEEAIINHLQKFLLEMGRGFCFEARQKRITFDNKHYRIDMVFYHRILKCHVLIDLKLGEFSHADAGQMNVYLNYYKDNEVEKGDNAPIGIILCAGKNDTLVKYATSGMEQQIFVSKYMVNLPSEIDLKRIIAEEQRRLL